MENNLQVALIKYVTGAFDGRAPDPQLEPYLACLASGSASTLTQIATAVNEGAGVAQPPRLLDDLEAFIQRRPTLDDAARSLLSAFANDPHTTYEQWIYAIRRAATSIQGRRGEPGVSLYHEFKILSALVHATHFQPDNLQQGFLLVAGDFPGVQRFIYNIPSDGATKKVRGRSFFLQLLADCTVLRLLAAAGDLPITNALYIAGGKFRLLLPADAGQIIREAAHDINQRLLHQYGGDLRLILAAVPVSAEVVANAEAYKDANQQLSRDLLRAKTQPFREFLGTETMNILLEPEMDSLDEAEPDPDKDRDDPYAALAVALATTQHEQPHLVFTPDQVKPSKGNDYAGLLGYLTGWKCEVVAKDRLKFSEYSRVLLLNDFQFETSGAHGFRLLAAQTPLTKKEDLAYWREQYEGKDLRREDEREPEVGQSIRNFEFLAVQGGKAKGLKRYGVLRMDVDELGTLFGKRLEPATLTRYIALSDALSLFFEGYVPHLCRQLEEEEGRPESLYLIYGGGDDLFVVGEWDLLPKLAWRIREGFRQFSNGQMSISAGLVLLTARFPFYQAAEMAREALDDKAKEYGRNAICMFDAVLNWDKDWPTVDEQHERLMEIARATGSSITQNVMEIYSQWRKEAQDPNRPELLFGPYKWRAAYQMSRLARQYKDRVNYDDIRQIQEKLLDPETIRLSGPAARWAELELRTREKDRGDEHDRAFDTSK